MGTQPFTSLMTDPHQDISRVSSFGRFLKRIFPYGIIPPRKCSIKASTKKV